jgi:putative oxidoreductase
MRSHIQALSQKVEGTMSHLDWLPPLLARLTLAGVFVESGWGKIHNIEKVTEFFTSLGIPAPAAQAHFVAYLELLGGVFLFLGLFTRLFSIPLAFTMVVAIITAKREDLKEFSDLFGFSEFLYILLFIWLIIEGAGKASLDYLLVKKKTS